MLNKTPPNERAGPAASPTIYDVAPEWVKLNAVLQQLLQLEADLLAKARALNEKYGHRVAADYWARNSGVRPPKTKAWSDGVKRLLGPLLPSEEEAVPESGIAPPPGVDELNRENRRVLDAKEAPATKIWQAAQLTH